VVGWSSTASGELHGFLWKKGVMEDLGTLPGGSESIAFSINPAGQVVGYSTTAGGDSHAVLWDRGAMTDLGTLPGGRNSVAYGISERGDVVGFSGTADSFHAALWRLK
jgi:probable HAF family extracellular repeat protein